MTVELRLGVGGVTECGPALGDGALRHIRTSSRGLTSNAASSDATALSSRKKRAFRLGRGELVHSSMLDERVDNDGGRESLTCCRETTGMAVGAAGQNLAQEEPDDCAVRE